jgi:molecular chaperone Hsp33
VIRKPATTDRKDRIRTASEDQLLHFILEGGTVKGVLCHGTGMIREMRTTHGLGLLETLVLGHAYMGAGMMASGLKSSSDRLLLQIDCSGPIKGVTVESSAGGAVRGYLKQTPIPVAQELADFNLSGFFGAGFLKVTRHLEGAKHPFEGQTLLAYGNVAQDLAYYYKVSEQIPTAFNLSIQFDNAGEVTGAGAMMLQMMPGAGDGVADQLESAIAAAPSLGAYFSGGGNPETMVTDLFRGQSPKVLRRGRLEFYCPCDKDRLRRVLLLLPMTDLKDLRDNGPHPVELRCHNCNSRYAFESHEIHEMVGQREAFDR